MAFPTATAANQTYLENGVAYISSADGSSFVWKKNTTDPFPQYQKESEIGSAYYEADIVGDGTETSWPINHQLNSDNPMVVVRAPVSGTSFSDGDDFLTKDASVEISNLNNLTLTIDPPIQNGTTWRVAILGMDLLSGIVAGGGDNFISLDNLKPAYYSETIIGDGTDTTWTIDHDLNSGHLLVEVRSPTSGNSFVKGEDYNIELATVTVTSANQVTLVIDPAIPDEEEWQVGIVGMDLLDGIISGGGTVQNITVDGVTSHGDLDDLGEDDHLIYARADGSRGAFDPTGSAAAALTSANANTSSAVSTHNGLINAHLSSPVTVSPSSGSLTYSVSSSKYFVTSLTANITTITVSNWLPSQVDSCRIVMSYSGSVRAITWPASWYWIGGVAASPPASGEHLVIDLVTHNGGTTIYASAAPMKQV